MKRPSPALVLACIAVFLAATGGAVAGVQINGKQIKDGSITGKDIKNDSLTGTDIKGDTRGPEGPRGPQGPPGAQGPQGPAGGLAASSAGVAVTYRSAEATIAPEDFKPVVATCPAGQAPVGGSYTSLPYGVRVIDERPVESDAGVMNGWGAFVDNGSEETYQLTVFVACVAASSVSVQLP
jgi:hypothetical protein